MLFKQTLRASLIAHLSVEVSDSFTTDSPLHLLARAFVRIDDVSVTRVDSAQLYVTLERIHTALRVEQRAMEEHRMHSEHAHSSTYGETSHTSSFQTSERCPPLHFQLPHHHYHLLHLLKHPSPSFSLLLHPVPPPTPTMGAHHSHLGFSLSPPSLPTVLSLTRPCQTPPSSTTHPHTHAPAAATSILTVSLRTSLMQTEYTGRSSFQVIDEL